MITWFTDAFLSAGFPATSVSVTRKGLQVIPLTGLNTVSLPAVSLTWIIEASPLAEGIALIITILSGNPVIKEPSGEESPGPPPGRIRVRNGTLVPHPNRDAKSFEWSDEEVM